MHFSRKFDRRPDLTRSGPRTKNNMCNREISPRRFDCFLREALRPPGSDRQGGLYPSPSTGEGGETRKTGEGHRAASCILQRLSLLLPSDDTPSRWWHNGPPALCYDGKPEIDGSNPHGCAFLPLTVRVVDGFTFSL